MLNYRCTQPPPPRAATSPPFFAVPNGLGPHGLLCSAHASPGATGGLSGSLDLACRHRPARQQIQQKTLGLSLAFGEQGRSTAWLGLIADHAPHLAAPRAVCCTPVTWRQAIQRQLLGRVVYDQLQVPTQRAGLGGEQLRLHEQRALAAATRSSPRKPLEHQKRVSAYALASGIG